MSGHAWELDAACANDPRPDDWFEGAKNSKTRERSLRICFRCPVRDRCLEAVLAVEAELGIDPIGTAGGLTAPQRKRLRVAS